MVAGSWTLACMLLVAGAAPDDVAYLNQRAIKIPLELTAAQRTSIRELTLFSSTDLGKTWHQEAVCSPEQDGFKFFAPTDGLFWFTVSVIDKQGNRSPEDIYKSPPSQKILIDTLKPLVKIVSAQRKGNEFEVAWEIQEDHPDLTSLKLEYRTTDAPSHLWYSAPLDPALKGKTSFRLNNPAAVTIRLQMADLARNATIAETEIAAATGLTTTSLKTDGSGKSSAEQTSGSDKTGTSTTKVDGDMGFNPVPVGTDQKLHEVKDNDSNGTDLGSNDTKKVAASTDKLDQGGSISNSAKVSGSQTGKLPRLRIVKNKQVTLEYVLDKVGPSGIGAVELWLTQDDGLSWRRYAEDPEVKAPLANGRHQRTVDLPGEGVFGITLVVRSKAGLGKSPPKPGDMPQMRIEVDTTPPVAQLFVPKPHAKRRDTLVITWTARDPNHSSLPASPITLQWAEHKGGAWQTIAANIANTGSHEWQLPAKMPERVYLRLVVRDHAGNLGVAETAEPQLVDLNEPEGTILGIVNPSEQ